MSNYPKIITEDVIKRYADITDDEIVRDIRDTMAEVDVLKKRVQDRVAFIVFLNALLTARKDRRP